MSKPDYSGTYHLVEQVNMDDYLEVLGNCYQKFQMHIRVDYFEGFSFARWI